jgi:hypothetical protein
MPSLIMGRPVSEEEVWESVRAEFALPALEQVRRRLAELMEDPAPVMRQLVRVFLSGLNRLCWSAAAVSLVCEVFFELCPEHSASTVVSATDGPFFHSDDPTYFD